MLEKQKQPYPYKEPMMTTPEYTKPSLPEEAFQLGRKYQLGEPQEQYGTESKFFAGCIILVVLGIIGPVIAAGGLRSSQGIVAIVIVLLVFSFAFLSAFLQRKWRVYVYTDGFVYIKGRVVQALRWNEIELVREVRYRIKVTYYPGARKSMWIIRSKQGRAIVFGNELSSVRELMRTIETHVEKVQ